MSLNMRRMCHKNKKHNRNSLTGASLCASLPGFYVIEAAVSVPVFVSLMVGILFFFSVQQIEMEVQAALNYTGRMLAEASVLEDGEEERTAAEMAEAELIFRRHLKKQEVNFNDIVGKKAGISLLASKPDKEYVQLKAVYRIRFPITLLGRHSYTIRQQAKVRRWKGDADRIKEQADWVYITDTGKAYHKSAACPYLDLSIRGVAASQIKQQRNRSGGVYSPCGRCENHAGEVVYITDYGTVYHTGLGCSGLKRSVQRVRRTEAGGYHACPKCGG